ncbi:MAG: hypothetical protein GY742_14500 [Hyphomicrobiales bacterium]|nr:hypothetical protein [Hyphomicrobiales bacterium]
MATKHYTSWADLSILDIAKWYVYGTLDPAENFDERMRPESDAPPTISVDAQSHLVAGPGRYYNPSIFPLVEAFFAKVNAGEIPDGEYSIQQILDVIGYPAGDARTDAIQIQFSQYETDRFSDDYYLRAFV